MDLIDDGMTTVVWASSIANIAAPTVAECTAGKNWTDRITPDGLKTDPTTADVDNSSLASRFDTKTVGRIGYDAELTFKRGTTVQEDAPYQTLKYKTSGYLLVRRGVDYETAFAAGQQVEVYPMICGERANVAPTANSVTKFVSPMKVTLPPVTDAVVAA